jgi:ABC transporter
LAALAGTGALSAPAFVAVCLLVIVAFEPIVALPGAITARARAHAASARLVEVFPESPPAAPTRFVDTGPATIEIRLGDRDTELTLSAGDTVLLTGASGAGKSTILRAISGQPAPGAHAYVAGVDTASVDPEDLAAHVTLVAQDAYMFDGTIRDNLRLADPDASEASSGRSSAPPRSTTPWRTSQAVSTPRSVPAGRPCQGDNAAGSAWRRACSGAAIRCSSTSRPRAWTPPPPLACWRASASSIHAPRS